MTIYLTTSGRGRLQHIIFAPSHHFSPDFLGTCVHYYYICNVNILTPDHAPPDCHNAVGAHDHSEPPCFRHCWKQREQPRHPTLQIHRQRARPHPRTGLDWLHKGGVTTREDFLVNNKEVISEFNIYITGNSNETLITGNGIKNENILRRELGKEERKEDEHPE